MPARIERLLERQGDRLAALRLRNVTAIARAFDAARRALKEDLERLIPQGDPGLGPTPWTAQRARAALALTEGALRSLVAEWGPLFTDGIQATSERALADLVEIIGEFEPEFLLTGNEINLRALARITETNGLALHRYSLERYSLDVINEVQRKVGVALAKGEGVAETVKAISSVDGVVNVYGRPRAELIARMELSRAYNDSHLTGIQTFADLSDVPVLKRIIEVRDRRNHPASRVAHGLTASPKEAFRLPVDPVEIEAIKLYRQQHPTSQKSSVKVTGVVWHLVGDHWEGMAPPIHFNDRSRVIPWRESWAADGAGDSRA